MATLAQRENGTFYTQFFDSTRTPSKKRVYHKTRLKPVAEAYHASIVNDHEDGLYDPWKEPWTETLRTERLAAAVAYRRAHEDLNPVPLEVAAGRYIVEKSTEIRKTTLANYEMVVRLFIQHVGPAELTTALSPDMLKEFLTQGDLRVTSQNIYKDWLKTFFRWCVEQNYLREDISSQVKLRRPPKKFPRFLMPAEVRHLISVIEEDNEPRKHWKRKNHLWLVPIIQTMSYCGLRREEFVNLRWNWINFDLEKLTICQGDGGFETKSGLERTITLADSTLRLFEVLREQRGRTSSDAFVFQDYRGKLTGDHVTKTFAHYRKVAGLREGITVHSLRHTALSWLAMAGVDVESIRVFAGHADIETTQKYMHVAPEYHHNKIRNALAEYDFDLNPAVAHGL